MNRREALKRTALVSGYALSATMIAGVLKGCKAEKTLNWKPAFLTDEQAHQVMELADNIIPTSDTPGATDVGVHQYIDQMLKECLSNNEQTIFTTGLDKLESDSTAKYGKSFIKTSMDQRKELLDQYDIEAYQANQKGGGEKPFFTLMKQLSFSGYFTSEVVGTEVLRYDPIPTAYQGCIPYKQGDRRWYI